MAYATSFLTVGIIWINHHAALSRLRVADHAVLVLNMPMAATERHRLLVRDIGGAIPYVLATALAPVSPYLTLAITAAVAAFYAVPARPR